MNGPLARVHSEPFARVHSEPLARVHSATKRFGEFTAVREVELEVHPGEIVGLLGANGAGKTTLIRMLLGLTGTTSGSVELFGQPPSRQTRGRLGYVPQGLGLYDDLTAAENLAFSAAAFGSGAPAGRRHRALRCPVGRLDVARDTAPVGVRAGPGARSRPADPRRTHLRRRPARPRQAVGDDRRSGAGRGRRARHHALPGGSGGVRPAGDHGRRRRRRGRNGRCHHRIAAGDRGGDGSLGARRSAGWKTRAGRWRSPGAGFGCRAPSPVRCGGCSGTCRQWCGRPRRR